MAEGNEANVRVTIRELFAAIHEQDRERAAMELRLMEKLNVLPAMCQQIQDNKEEIDALRKRSNILDGVNFVSVAIAGVLGALGIRSP